MYDLDFARAGDTLSRRRAILHDLEPGADDFRAALADGLSRPDKALPCRFLYDARGSALFDRICELPEYYPTRTELGILKGQAADIAAAIGPGVQLVELGSGSSLKVRLLLDALEAPTAYVPVDISRDHLLQAAQRIQDDYPDIRVEAICADYGQGFELPPATGRRVGFYPGSTIGNLTPAEAETFMRLWAKKLGPGAAMLVGVDLQKSASILNPAYDDAEGVTAQFSLNLLHRANRELGTDFDVSAFRHRARYLEDEGRVAIHLVSQRDQTVRLGKQAFEIAAGEAVHIEDSWKYTLPGFKALARASGYEPVAAWTDEARLFSLHLLEVAA